MNFSLYHGVFFIFFRGQKFGAATAEGYGCAVEANLGRNKYNIVISFKTFVIDGSGQYLSHAINMGNTGWQESKTKRQVKKQNSKIKRLKCHVESTESVCLLVEKPVSFVGLQRFSLSGVVFCANTIEMRFVPSLEAGGESTKTNVVH